MPRRFATAAMCSSAQHTLDLVGRDALIFARSGPGLHQVPEASGVELIRQTEGASGVICSIPAPRWAAPPPPPAASILPRCLRGSY